jgi:hypothetical protein
MARFLLIGLLLTTGCKSVGGKVGLGVAGGSLVYLAALDRSCEGQDGHTCFRSHDTQVYLASYIFIGALAGAGIAELVYRLTD